MQMKDIDTPAVLIDMDRAEANMARAQDYADNHGLPLRPHVKTHRLPMFATAQIALGAHGITCQKLGEAEVMAAAGLRDILVTFNIIGAAKLERLAALHAAIRIAVVADNARVVEGYAARFRDPDRPLDVMVECETGARRCGVMGPAEAAALAALIDAAPGLRCRGLMTYPPKDGIDNWLPEARDLILAAGGTCDEISSGGSPRLYQAHETEGITEYRPGTYIYSDRMQVAAGLGTLEDCALTVLATVVSMPERDRAVLDAGSKALAADLCTEPGHGILMDYPGAIVTTLSEEHGVVDLSGTSGRPEVGDRVRVIPNHACVVSNLFDVVHLVRNGRVEPTPVAARGRSQ